MSERSAAKNFIKAGVVGYPVKHSLSPVIHTHWINKYDLEGSYEHIEIAPDDFDQVITKFKDEQIFDGFNVTLPYKQRIMDFCDELDDTARKIGAVNTVSFKGGRMTGKNTDAFGFTENLKSFILDFDFTKAPALVLGAGGAARAIVYGLRDSGVNEIYIANRTAEKSGILVNDFGNNDCKCHVVDWNDRLKFAGRCGLIVNTTSLGMTGKGALDFDVSGLADDTCVYDIVYAPLYTQILQDARARNLDIVTGIGMLLHQARPAFESWFGVMPDVDDALVSKVMSDA